MFDENIENTSKGIISTFESSPNGNFNFKSLLNNPKLAPVYKNFFEAELNWWIFAEVSDLVNSEHFDFTTTSFFSSNLDEELRTAAFITEYKLNEFVEFAVTTRLNFLCRPQFTLESFLYNGRDSISCDEAIMRLNYFTDYPYFKKELNQWFTENQENEIEFIKQEDFKNKVSDIEYEFVLNLDSIEFVNLLDPLYEFFNTKIENSEDQLIPTEALMIFFSDKNIKPLVKILEKNYINNEQKLITKEELYNFINEMIEASDNDEIDAEDENQSEETYLTEEVDNFNSVENYEMEAENEIEDEDNIDEVTEDIEEEVLNNSEENYYEDESELVNDEIESENEIKSEVSITNDDFNENLSELENLLSSNDESQDEKYSEEYDLLGELNSLDLNSTENNSNNDLNVSLQNLNTLSSINSELESFAENDEELEEELEEESDITTEYSNLKDYLDSNYENKDANTYDELLEEIKEISDIDESELNIPTTTENTDLKNLDDYANDIENLIN